LKEIRSNGTAVSTGHAGCALFFCTIWKWDRVHS